MKLHWEHSRGGANGMCLNLRLDDKWLGHFYVDSDDNEKTAQILSEMSQFWNEKNSKTCPKCKGKQANFIAFRSARKVKANIACDLCGSTGLVEA